MILSYEQFLKENQDTSRENTASIMGVNFKDNLCLCMNKDMELYTLPINILVLDMMNDMCHINDASKLKNWSEWGKEIDYPEDYFDNVDKYVKKEETMLTPNGSLIDNKKLQDYVSEDGSYIIPVEWTVYSTVKVNGAKNLADAIRIFNEKQEEIDLDTEPEYVDGSYHHTLEDAEQAIAAQNYAEIGDGVSIDANEKEEEYDRD